MATLSKPAIRLEQQQTTPRPRDLNIPDQARARHDLGKLRYFRRSACTRLFLRAAQPPRIPERIGTGAHHKPAQALIPGGRLYLQLVVIESLMRVVCPDSGWADRLLQLLNRYPCISRPHMGFPPGWEHEPFWRNAKETQA